MRREGDRRERRGTSRFRSESAAEAVAEAEAGCEVDMRARG